MRVTLFFLLLFPLIELAVLIKVGSVIGVGWTLLLLVAGAFAGDPSAQSRGPHGPNVIEGEFERRDNDRLR